MTEVFTKGRSGAPAGFYRCEAAGLHWLDEASGAPVVQVLAVDDEHISLAKLASAPATRTMAEEFGRQLAQTHAAGAAAFGQPPDGWQGAGWIGVQELPLDPDDAWGRFYAEQRLWPYAVAAHARGNLSSDDLSDIERLCGLLRDGLFDDGQPPARIHGDLWSGNVMWTPQGAVLIDPAAHGGHPITDLAMLNLFGAPQLATINAAYAEAAGLDSGWPSLIPLHQLHPLLVHAVTHSASYGHEAAQIVRSLG